MQTFLPCYGFMDTAESLDRQRLGKQRVETRQILDALMGYKSGWKNHPIVHAWRGYEEALTVYGLYICSAWRERGYRDSLFPWFQRLRLDLRAGGRHMTERPLWTENPEIHQAYKKILVWKEPEHYEEVFDMVVLKEPEFPWELMKNG